MCVNPGTVDKPDMVCKGAEKPNGREQNPVSSLQEEGRREAASGKDGSLKQRCIPGRGNGWGELVSLRCRPAGGPSVWGSPPAAYCISIGRGGMIQTCEQYQFVHHAMSLYEKQLSLQSSE